MRTLLHLEQRVRCGQGPAVDGPAAAFQHGGKWWEKQPNPRPRRCRSSRAGEDSASASREGMTQWEKSWQGWEFHRLQRHRKRCQDDVEKHGAARPGIRVRTSPPCSATHARTMRCRAADEGHARRVS